MEVKLIETGLRDRKGVDAMDAASLLLRQIRTHITARATDIENPGSGADALEREHVRAGISELGDVRQGVAGRAVELAVIEQARFLHAGFERGRYDVER